MSSVPIEDGRSPTRARIFEAIVHEHGFTSGVVAVVGLSFHGYIGSVLLGSRRRTAWRLKRHEAVPITCAHWNGQLFQSKVLPDGTENPGPPLRCNHQVQPHGIAVPRAPAPPRWRAPVWTALAMHVTLALAKGKIHTLARKVQSRCCAESEVALVDVCLTVSNLVGRLLNAMIA